MWALVLAPFGCPEPSWENSTARRRPLVEVLNGHRKLVTVIQDRSDVTEKDNDNVVAILSQAHNMGRSCLCVDGSSTCSDLCGVLEWAELQMTKRGSFPFRSPWYGGCEGTTSRWARCVV